MKGHEKIRQRRKELKMTQSELASLVGYSGKTMISMIEQGKVDLPSSKVKLFAKALGLSAYDLMGIEDYYVDTINAIDKSHRAQSVLSYALTLSGYFDGVEFSERELNRIIKYAKLVLEEREDGNED